MRRSVGVLVALLAVVAVAGAGDPPGTPASRAALERCHRADELPDGERAAAYDGALSDAEAAVAADDRDALAHFAVFCALGGRMRIAGVSVSSLTRLRRLRAEVDRTLELAPDFPDALAGKAALLLDTPRLLGGDPAAAEPLLRHAIALDPDWLRPRLDLVRALLARGAKAEAADEARRALAIAERTGDADDVARARKLLADAGGA
jgi:tetratricopeptide (TPR) repeat protein